MAWPGGNRASPFVWFNTAPTQGNPNWLNETRLKRVSSHVRKAGELIMLVEASNTNWYDQTQSSTYPGLFLRRLGARHGKKTANGANAWTNFAFFDGHVALFPTEPISLGGFAALNRDHIFFLGSQPR